MLTQIGGQNRDKVHFMITPHEPFPRMLEPGEYVLEYSHDLSALGEKLNNLTAIDSLKRTWKAPKKQVRKLKEAYASGKYKKKNR